MRIIVSLELHVGDDLPVVRGQFIIGCLGIRGICDVIVKDREILHLAKPFCVVGVEMPRHQDLVDRFLDATKGRGENHIAQGFAHKEFLWEMQAHAVDLFLDYFVFGVGVAVACMCRVVAAHRCVILEGASPVMISELTAFSLSLKSPSTRTGLPASSSLRISERKTQASAIRRRPARRLPIARPAGS